MSSIILNVTHPQMPPGPIAGFRFLWAFYVNGYRPERHCQPCFRGRRVEEFCTVTARSGPVVVFDRMDRYPYLYICGVGSGPRRELGAKNLHLPVEFSAGAVVERETFNGYRFRLENARLLDIPELPEGWEGKDREHTRCKNYRFAVSRFAMEPRGTQP